MTQRVRRRENAPIRKRRPATTVPDLLFALAAGAWTMGITLVVAGMIDEELVAGEAGKTLAVFFAAALGVAGLLLFLMGLTLLRDERGQGDHYTFPMLLGGVLGVGEALLFLFTAGAFIIAPFILVLLALRPVRRALHLLPGGAR